MLKKGWLNFAFHNQESFFVFQIRKSKSEKLKKMGKTSKRKKKDDDEDWDPKGKRKKEVCKKKNKHPGESCFIHCTDSNEDLTKLPSLESWEKLLNAAQIRQDENVLQLASSSSGDEDSTYPEIYYHLKCRNAYTHWKTLETLSKVSIKLFVQFFSKTFQTSVE